SNVSWQSPVDRPFGSHDRETIQPTRCKRKSTLPVPTGARARRSTIQIGNEGTPNAIPVQMNFYSASRRRKKVKALGRHCATHARNGKAEKESKSDSRRSCSHFGVRTVRAGTGCPARRFAYCFGVPRESRSPVDWWIEFVSAADGG